MRQKFTQQKLQQPQKLYLSRKQCQNSTSVSVPTKNRNYSKQSSIKCCTDNIEICVVWLYGYLEKCVVRPVKTAVRLPRKTCCMAALNLLYGLDFSADFSAVRIQKTTLSLLLYGPLFSCLQTAVRTSKTCSIKCFLSSLEICALLPQTSCSALAVRIC